MSRTTRSKYMLDGLKLIRCTVSLLEPLHAPLQAKTVIRVGSPTSDRPGGSIECRCAPR
jgi:hypothetical protein